MNHISYQNDETMDFLTWMSRHRCLKNDMGKAFSVCREYPQFVDAIRSFRTGSYDIRLAVARFVEVTKGDMASFLERDKIKDIMIIAWRKYQNYLRSRDDRDAVEQHVAQREAYESGKGLEPVDVAIDVNSENA